MKWSRHSQSHAHPLIMFFQPQQCTIFDISAASAGALKDILTTQHPQLDGVSDKSVEPSLDDNQVPRTLAGDGAMISKTDPDASREEVCKVDAATQWEDMTTAHHTYSAPLKLVNIRTPLLEKMTAADLRFYTGVSPDIFKKLALCIQRTPLRPSQLHTEDQLLLALMRLRLGLLYRDLASRFCIAPSSVCNIFKNVLKSLKEIMKYVVIWLPRSRIQSTMPSAFIENGFQTTTCIFDCTEVALERPTKQKPRAQTYSSYKAHNTVKFLVVIAPNGLIMYISRAFGGRASDKFIVRQSGVQEYLVPGDVIMADRGFTLDPYLEAQGIKLNMPAFTKGKGQLSEQEVTSTRRIASVRIHVERAINRIKTYRILKSALSIKCKDTIDSMIFVCAGLCNLKAPLIAQTNGRTSQEL
ncbi:uncharacterized protein [Dermacentor albipictus]|uniref:uncharacterized protein isoform X3 n=1 Tax=Dermacentor albipictus TaxID=60249 RepID=UPI0038FC96FB